MSTSPLDVYGEDLRTALRGAPPVTWLRYADGRRAVVDLPRWTEPARGADLALLARCRGAVLDVGAGPGRLTRALQDEGVECLGVDVAPVAVEVARLAGTYVLHASVYDAVLDGTGWSTVLLADGNVGIGGDAVALLRRCRDLLLPGGTVLVELDGPGTPTGTVQVRLESSRGDASAWFPWAHVSITDAAAVAEAAGLALHEAWESGGRWFAELRSTVVRTA